MKRRPFKGNITLADNSSLRKLMRAIRRDALLEDHQGIISRALASAAERRGAYLNSSPAHSAYVANRR